MEITPLATQDSAGADFPNMDFNNMQILPAEQDPYAILDKHENLPGGKPFKNGKTTSKIDEGIMVCLDAAQPQLLNHFCWPNEYEATDTLVEFKPKTALAVTRLGYPEDFQSFAQDLKEHLLLHKRSQVCINKYSIN